MNLRFSGLSVQGTTRLVLAAALACAAFSPLAAQEKSRTRLDATHYVIDADVNPATQTLTAQVQMEFTPLENTSSIALELNNALNVSRIVDGNNRQIPASRSQGDSTVRLNFPDTTGTWGKFSGGGQTSPPSLNNADISVASGNVNRR